MYHYNHQWKITNLLLTYTTEKPGYSDLVWTGSAADAAKLIPTFRVILEGKATHRAFIPKFGSFKAKTITFCTKAAQNVKARIC